MKMLDRNLFLCPNVSSPQKEMDKTKGQRDYEEKLIVSAWYNMVRKPESRHKYQVFTTSF